jgi:hypothetical protein
MHRSASPLKIPRIALGCMGFGSSAWRPWVLDEPAALAVLAQALEADVVLGGHVVGRQHGHHAGLLAQALEVDADQPPVCDG